jgi:protein ImuA
MRESSALIPDLRRIAMPGVPAQADPRPASAWLDTGMAAAQLHELYVADTGDAASGAGFAIAQALAADAVPMLWIRTEASERQGGRPHAAGLADLGLDAARLLLVVVADEAALLRAAADAARCTGLGTLLVETWGRSPGLDLTATRRLMLAAEASGVTVLSLRVGAEQIPSAAATRWGIAPVASSALAANAPGLPAFDIELLRRRGGPPGARWRVEWNRDAKSFVPLAGSGRSALPGAGLPLVAGRAVARHPAASVRRTG